MKKAYLALAFFFVGLGAIGVALPILPTVPFLLLASFFFSKGSERYHRWFQGTKLYQNHLRDFSQQRAMTRKSKLTILIPVTVMLLLAMLLVRNRYMTICILLLMAVKYYYFFFRIRTLKETSEAGDNEILSENRRT